MWTKANIASLTAEEFDRLPLSERRLIVLFQTDQLAFAGLPHLITTFSLGLLEEVKRVTSSNLGLWNHPVLEGPYLWPSLESPPAPFSAWAEARSQEELLQICDGAAMRLSDRDVVVCDCSLPEAELAQLLEPAFDLEFLSEGVWALIPEIVRGLGWIIIPLTSDADAALLVADSRFSGLVSAVEQWCCSEKIGFGRLEEIDGKLGVVDYSGTRASSHPSGPREWRTKGG